MAAAEQPPSELDGVAADLAFTKSQVDRDANRAFIELLRATRTSALPDIQAQGPPGRGRRAARDTCAQDRHPAPDLTARDVVLLSCDVYRAAESLLDHDPDASDRCLHVVFNGMRRHGPGRARSTR